MADDDAERSIFDSLSVARFSPIDPEYGALREELIGVIIDHRTSIDISVFRHDDKFFLPVSLLEKLGVSISVKDNQLYLGTPGGEVVAPLNYFRRIAGGIYFMDDLLDQELKVQWEFNSEKYALDITLPWWRRHENRRGTDRAALEPDFKPSSFGLTQARLDHSRYSDDNNSHVVNELLLRGRLAEGSWQADVIAVEDRDVRAEDYYWLRDFDHVQALVGNQDVLINPLLPEIRTTGVQALYNSKPLEFNPYQDQTRNQYIRRLGIPVKDIEGVARPGAIAELRINDRLTARVRVRLDGTYEFNQVRLPSLQFATVQVHILDQRSLQTIEVQDFTQTPSELLLDGGQTVAFTGIGVSGNPLDPARDVGDEAVFGLWRYGLSDRVTLEVGLQSANGNVHEVAGLAASLGKQWTTSVSLGHHEGNVGYSSDLFGHGRGWNFNLRSQNLQDEFRSQRSLKSFRHDLRYEYSLTPRLVLGVYGRSIQSGDNENDFFLPGATWRFNSRGFLRTWPDAGGGYRTELRSYHRESDWFEFIHDDTGYRAEYRFHQNEKLEYFARLEDRREAESAIVEIGAAWYPREFDDRSSVHASVLTHDGKFGYRFEWRTALLPGFYSQLELRDEPRASEFSDPGLQLRWTLSVDFAFAGGRPIPGRNEFTNSRAGSIGGKLTLRSGAKVSSREIDLVSLIVDGVPHTAVVNGGHFLLEDLLPGVYQVSLSPEYLPMDLTPLDATYRVKVAPSATTKVNFTLAYEYGVAGQILFEDGQPAIGRVVNVYDSQHSLIHSTRTDQYGYYRLSGLEPGDYVIEVSQESQAAIEGRITIENTDLFDTDFTVQHDELRRHDPEQNYRASACIFSN